VARLIVDETHLEDETLTPFPFGRRDEADGTAAECRTDGQRPSGGELVDERGERIQPGSSCRSVGGEVHLDDLVRDLE